MVKVILIMVESVDGVIAHSNDELVTWSSKEDKRQFVEVTKSIGCTVCGINTFNTFLKPFQDRHQIILTSSPDRYSEEYIENKMLHFISAETPSDVLKKVSTLGFDTVALIGGSTVNSFFADSHLINEVWVTIEPMIFGKGLHLFSRSLDLKLRLLDHSKLNSSTLLAKYEVTNNHL